MMEREKVMKRAEEIARVKDPGIYYMRNDPDFRLIWRARVADAYEQACNELYPPPAGCKWAMGRFIVHLRRDFRAFIKFVLNYKK